MLTDAFVRRPATDGRADASCRPQHGVRTIEAGAVVLAIGARERTRGAIRIPGTRPAGVMTAGLAQKFVNMIGLLPGPPGRHPRLG